MGNYFKISYTAAFAPDDINSTIRWNPPGMMAGDAYSPQSLVVTHPYGSPPILRITIALAYTPLPADTVVTPSPSWWFGAKPIKTTPPPPTTSVGAATLTCIPQSMDFSGRDTIVVAGENMPFRISASSQITMVDSRGNPFRLTVTYVSLSANTQPMQATFSVDDNTVLSNTPLNITITPNPSNIPSYIYYTTDGSVPTTSSTEYTTGIPVVITKGCVLRACVTPIGDRFVGGIIYVRGNGSKITIISNPGADQTLSCSSLPSNAIAFKSATLPVTLATIPQGVKTKIYYTLDGSDPTEKSLIYVYRNPIILNSTTTIKVLVVPDLPNPARLGMTKYIQSSILSKTYTKYGECALPVLTPNSIDFTSTLNVAIACTTAGAQIRYTIDGTEPKDTSPIISVGTILLSNNATIKAKAFDPTKTLSPSATVTGVYKKTDTAVAIEDQSNVTTNSLGMNFIIIRHTDGFVCQLWVPKFPRTVVNGDVLGQFQTMGIVWATALESTAIFLIEEPDGYGSLLATIYLDDDTTKRFRSHSNGKTWEDVSDEVIL